MNSFKLLASIALLGALVFANGAFAETKTETITSSSGTLSSFTPKTIVIQTTTTSDPVPYTFTKTTTYVDENGDPVAIDTVKSGEPMTVFYTQDGDVRVASKVVVKRSVTTDSMGTKIEEKKTTVTTP